mmetsp:Transcript_32212/g.42476  ORF Transcript_32212/g.42476 Transcript_32212/m.42476 type:complete len:128 (+) Transcript_32212:550-933(+)
MVVSALKSVPAADRPRSGNLMLLERGAYRSKNNSLYNRHGVGSEQHYDNLDWSCFQYKHLWHRSLFQRELFFLYSWRTTGAKVPEPISIQTIISSPPSSPLSKHCSNPHFWCANEKELEGHNSSFDI